MGVILSSSVPLERVSSRWFALSFKKISGPHTMLVDTASTSTGRTFGGKGANVGKLEGASDGRLLGVVVGREEGDWEGRPVGRELGVVVGRLLGVVVGRELGVVDGRLVGSKLGVVDGRLVGSELGVVDGRLVGSELGVVDGRLLGEDDGICVGCEVGAVVGILVTFGALNVYTQPPRSSATPEMNAGEKIRMMDYRQHTSGGRGEGKSLSRHSRAPMSVYVPVAPCASKSPLDQLPTVLLLTHDPFTERYKLSPLVPAGRWGGLGWEERGGNAMRMGAFRERKRVDVDERTSQHVPIFVRSDKAPIPVARVGLSCPVLPNFSCPNKASGIGSLDVCVGGGRGDTG